MMIVSSDPVPAVTEADAVGHTAMMFSDIRATLGVEVVNLIWRHLATMPGALEWVWGELKPLYLGAAVPHANAVRNGLRLPTVPELSDDTLAAAGIGATDRRGIGSVLDSYHHTNALALVAFSSLLARFDGGAAPGETIVVEMSDATQRASRAVLPQLTPLSELPPPVARLIEALNGFGEDEEFALVASMYRHLSHWPAYLALLRTLLAPLQANGELRALVSATRRMAGKHGRALAPLLPGSQPPADSVAPALAAVRRFVEHPIARMTAICSLIRHATPT